MGKSRKCGPFSLLIQLAVIRTHGCADEPIIQVEDTRHLITRKSDPRALAGSQAYRDLWELTVTPNPNDWSSRNSKSSPTKHRPSAIGVSIIRAPTDAALHSGSPRYLGGDTSHLRALDPTTTSQDGE
jgi:hypothetical protein